MSQNELWQSLFGDVWRRLTEVDANIGGFVLLDGKKQAITDANARRLLGLGEDADYDAVHSAIEDVENEADGYPLKVYFTDPTDEAVAGFLRLEEQTAARYTAYIFEMLTQPQLVKLMGDGGGDSLLALIRLEGVTSAAHAELLVTSALNAVSQSLPQNAVIAAHSEELFWIYIPDCAADPEEVLRCAKKAVEGCAIADEFGVTISEEHSMTLTAGFCRPLTPVLQRMHFARFALFDASTAGAGSICGFSQQRYEQQKTEFHNVGIFSRLIDQNLFIYHFQPIVSARTGEIIAYEALMRTDESIGLNPMQILSLAKSFGRLYDIEKFTLNNTLLYLSRHQEDFEKKKLFINSISSHMLRDEDYLKLRANYGELLEKVVLELTEQTEISDEDLARIHSRLKSDNMQLAIDDYGAGYSNTSNLLRYNPDIVKIDRSLVSNIDKDFKMRNIVSGIIDFLHESGYIALAEGVETSEELRCLIGLGADLIQGYYISRPKQVISHEISESVRKEIVRINLETGGRVQKIYHPVENEVVDVCRLALEKYTGIFVNVSNITLVGEPENTAPLCITVKEDSSCTITLKNVSLTSTGELPVLRVGGSSSVRVICMGENSFKQKGIFVPRNASLRLSGSGSLSVSAEAMNCYGIGADCTSSCGDITVDMTGKLSVSANGDRGVGIGSGKNSENRSIRILGGDISVSCSGDSCIGIGIMDGDADITLSDCCCNIECAAVHSVALGAFSGRADISVQSYSLSCRMSGLDQTAVGVSEGGSGSIHLSNGRLNVVLKGRTLTCVGSRGGEMSCDINESRLDLYCEGGTVSGIGDLEGGSEIKLTGTELIITFLTGNGTAICAPEGKVTIERGKHSIKINE